MATVRCKYELDGKVALFVCWLIVGDKRVGLANSMAKPVPVGTGTYDLVWELKGEIGCSVELVVTANGVIVKTLPKQTISDGVRIGSGGPKSPNYNPLKIAVP
ncbi:hypothetical protein [Massilia sp. YIM B04103]|uniref:hypothetical protein n=1 Tax=Massilia sp. YIM B04103 TaxID=2963106 RepID=UPI00210C6CEB|nr:hypothetical protein [Massilia sp. YIM B04103]